MLIKNIGEIGLVKRIARRVRTDKSVVRGIGDDTAVIRWAGSKYLLFTCDMLIEGVHFTRGKATPRQIGHKALARNISDIAAMGGVPKHALVSVALDPKLPVAFADGIFDGINELAKKFKINIVGGDTAHSKKILIDVSLIGEVEKKNLVLRGGAKEGDLIFVTGSIGGSQIGKHLGFTPRIAEARQLVGKLKINSMIDVSDGLILDLWRILDASNKGARIYEKLVPVTKWAGSFKKAVTAGEDFELLFTMSPKEALRASQMKTRTPISLIGRVMNRKAGYKLVTKPGRETPLGPKGYLHF